MRTVKVIAIWGGQREWQDEDYLIEENLSMLDFIIAQEKSLNYGVNMDLILVNSICKKIKKGYKKYIDRLNSLDGVKTKNGKIIVLHRENLGISNGAFDYAFQKYINKYDYWFFSEDDRITIATGVMLMAINMMKANKKIGFVAATTIRRCPEELSSESLGKRYYAVGSTGITHTKVLERILKLGLNKDESGKDHLPFCRNSTYSRGRTRAACWWRATYDFTRHIQDFGLNLSKPIYSKTVLNQHGVCLSFSECRRPPLDYLRKQYAWFHNNNILNK